MTRLSFNRLNDRRGSYHIAITRLDAGTQTVLHTHDFEEVFLVRAGSATHLINGREQLLKSGDVVWLRAADRHGFAVGRNRFEIVNLALAAGFLKQWRELTAANVIIPLRAGRLPHVVSLNEPSRLTVDAALMNLITARQAGVRGLVATLCGVEVALAIPARREQIPEWLESWRTAMHAPENVAKPLGWWQRQAGCTKEHLARSCRRHYGVTPTELLNAARVEWILDQLRVGDAKITALAFEAGFGHLGHFHKVFRKLTGNTPRFWQQQSKYQVVPLHTTVAGPINVLPAA